MRNKYQQRFPDPLLEKTFDDVESTGEVAVGNLKPHCSPSQASLVPVSGDQREASPAPTISEMFIAELSKAFIEHRETAGKR